MRRLVVVEWSRGRLNVAPVLDRFYWMSRVVGMSSIGSDLGRQGTHGGAPAKIGGHGRTADSR